MLWKEIISIHWLFSTEMVGSIWIFLYWDYIWDKFGCLPNYLLNCFIARLCIFPKLYLFSTNNLILVPLLNSVNQIVICHQTNFDNWRAYLNGSFFYPLSVQIDVQGYLFAKGVLWKQRWVSCLSIPQGKVLFVILPFFKHFNHFKVKFCWSWQFALNYQISEKEVLSSWHFPLNNQIFQILKVKYCWSWNLATINKIF